MEVSFRSLSNKAYKLMIYINCYRHIDLFSLLNAVAAADIVVVQKNS